MKKEFYFKNLGLLIILLIVATIQLKSQTIPQKPDLGHYISTVCQFPETHDYNILNPEAGVDYYWSINPSSAGSISGSPGTSVIITWNSFSQATIIIHCVNTTTGDTILYNYPVFAPCIPEDTGYIYLCNTTSIQANSIFPFQDNGSYSNTTFVINGYFIIDNNNMEFINCTFLMGPFANIQVADGITVTFIERNVFKIDSVCNYMWDGLYVEYPESKVIMNGASFNDAINGVFSKYGGKMALKGNIFKDNYIAIQVQAYSDNGIIDVSITSNKIYGNLALPYQPYLGADFCGILVNNVGTSGNNNGVIIGDYNSVYYKNDLIDLSIGIRIEESNVEIYNNYITTQRDCGMGISIYSDDFDVKYRVIIGEYNQYASNIIENYEFGIQCEYNYDLDIRENTISECLFSIVLHGNGDATLPQSQVNVFNNNIIDGRLKGIVASLNYNSVISIGCNNIVMLENTSGAIQIFADSKNNANEIYYIDANNIAADEGLYVINCHNVTFNSNNITIYDNPGGAGINHGIQIINCDYNYGFNNRILPENGSTATGLKYGIEIENTTHPLYVCNHINYTERGLNIIGDNSNNNAIVSLRQNEFNNNDFGMVKSNGGGFLGQIGTQGNPNTPWLNRFFNSNFWDAAGINSMVNDFCYHRSNLFSGEDFTTPPFSGFFKQLVSCSTCTVPLGPPAIACMAYPLNSMQNAYSLANDNLPYVTQAGNPAYKLLNDIISYTGKQDSIYTYMARQNVYSKMLHDKSLFQQDKGFSQFMAQCDNNSIGQLYRADYYIGKNKTDSAELFNNRVVVTNIADSTHKLVNTFFISYLRTKKLTMNELATIINISELCPFTNGDGVYIARALRNMSDSIKLDYADACKSEEIKQKSKQIEPPKQKDDILINLYPNPANDLINIEIVSTNLPEGQVSFELYDLNGRKIFTNVFNDVANNVVNTSNIEQGVYTYKLILNNKVLKQDKFIIIK